MFAKLKILASAHSGKLASFLGLPIVGWGLQQSLDQYHRTEWYAVRQTKTRVAMPVKPFQLKTQGTMTPNIRLEERIKDTLLVRTSGVIIQFAPPGMGKTTATRNVLHNLQCDQEAGALVVDCEEIVQHMSEGNKTSMYTALRHLIWKQLGIPEDSHLGHGLSHLFQEVSPPRVVLVLDHADLLCANDPAKKLEAGNLVKALAQDASQANAHTVLLNISDQELCQYFLNLNGKQKIAHLDDSEVDGTPFKWTKEELRQVLQKHKNQDNDTRVYVAASDEKEIIDGADGVIGKMLSLKDETILRAKKAAHNRVFAHPA